MLKTTVEEFIELHLCCVSERPGAQE